MAEIKPFRAVRYDESKAGPLASLVAPPYDVIGSEERLEYLERSPYNVVHLTLPDAEEQAARDFGSTGARTASSSTTTRRCGRSSRTTSAPTASAAPAAG